MSLGGIRNLDYTIIGCGFLVEGELGQVRHLCMGWDVGTARSSAP
jgi:hypothetical protein